MVKKFSQCTYIRNEHHLKINNYITTIVNIKSTCNFNQFGPDETYKNEGCLTEHFLFHSFHNNEFTLVTNPSLKTIVVFMA